MKRSKATLLFAVLLGTFLFPAWGQAQEEAEDAGVIELPSQRLKAINAFQQVQLMEDAGWQAFVEQHGSWSVVWNEATGTPHRAFGKSIPINGYSLINESNIEAAALRFVTDHKGALKADPEFLRLVRVQEVRNRWYVSYVQQHNGLEVLLSEVELRVFPNGNVVAFGSDYYSDIQVSTTPVLSGKQALQSATGGLFFDAAADERSVDDALYILPVAQGSGSVDYHLVYRVNVRTVSPAGNYVAYVDAHDGTVVWRYNRVRTVGGTVSGDVQLVLPTGPFVDMPLSDLYVNVDGNQVTTDSLGNFDHAAVSSGIITAELRGPWVNVNRQDGPDASFSTAFNPGDTVLIKWDDVNSHPAERDAFFHTNLIHNFITTLDPAFTNINYSMPCAVNIADVCNAFWNGTGINFFLAGGGCPNTGQMPSVVYHEYGHGINDKLYQQAGSSQGMINGATHEGMADVVAALIEDTPDVGRGFTGVGTVLRSLDNTNRYPESISGSVHQDGLIIGGAFWDLRVATDLQTARELSHFAKWGIPDDPNTGLAFSEWFVEVLVADDDDGDLNNGTPHFNEINDAFNAHGIGSSIYFSLSFSHTPLTDTQDTTGTYNVAFSLQGGPLAGSDADSVMVHYSVDGFQTTNSIPANEVTAFTFIGDIPAQPAGSIVQYYMTARDPIGNINLTFPATAPSVGSYSFLVGFLSLHLDDLEAESGWVVGAPDDNATTGIWERADPEPTFNGSTLVQSGDDHTPGGTMCFVTGASGGQLGANDVDNGKTTLFSPFYDLTNVQLPVIRYYKWYVNDAGAAPGQDFWVVDISNDGGQNWVNVENTNRSTDQWEKVDLKVASFITPTDNMQVRFVASDYAPGSLVEALIDDFEIFGTGGTITSIDDPLTEGLPSRYALRTNYPNPFNPSTLIKYDLPEASNVRLEVYNLLGEVVKTLFNGNQQAGFQSVRWDGTNNSGIQVSSGVYVYRMVAGEYVQSRKMMFLK